MGTAITEPYVYHLTQVNALVGFDVEIARYLAVQLNVRLAWVELPFASLIPALQENRVDMVIAAMYITPEREQFVDFADSYADTGLIMAVRPELVSQIRSIEDLAGHSAGVKIGATGVIYAEELVSLGIPLKIVRYRDTVESLLDLEVGHIDVVFNDYLNTLYFIKKNQADILVVTDTEGQVLFLSNAQLGIAVHEDNQSLLDAINQGLVTLRRDGTYERLYQDYIMPETKPGPKAP
jgi:ABC-type amino acid transport substrate-binding protein